MARLAQRLEHRICNAMVIGSIPIAGFSLFVLIFYIIDNVFLKSKNIERAFSPFFFQESPIYYVVGTSNYESK